MSWRIEFTRAAAKQIRALDPALQARIHRAITDKLLLDPRAHLLPLQGELRGVCKFRVGPVRLLCIRRDKHLLITVVKVARRRDAYRR